jgi:hypothetical protein
MIAVMAGTFQLDFKIRTQLFLTPVLIFNPTG